MSADVGALALTLAAHMRGGLTQQRALELLARENGEGQEIMQRIIGRVARGSTTAEAMLAEEEEPWKLLAATWLIAERTGAPIAQALERMSEALARLASLERRRQVLLAGPQGSVLLIASLPALAVVIGELLGVRVGAQFSTPLGLLLVGVGALLLVAGITWGLGMIRSVRQRDRAAGFELDLLWVALAGNSSPEQARRITVHTLDMIESSWVDLSVFARHGEATTVLASASESGIRLRDLVALRADNLRERTHRDLEREAERLALRVLLPLGLCILPAFVCIGVIPLLMGMLT